MICNVLIDPNLVVPLFIFKPGKSVMMKVLVIHITGI